MSIISAIAVVALLGTCAGLLQADDPTDHDGFCSSATGFTTALGDVEDAPVTLLPGKFVKAYLV